MKKILFSVLPLLLLFFPQYVYAKDNNFDISVESKYTVHDTGITTVSQTIHIKNKTEFYYTPTYTVSIGFSDIENIEASNSDGGIPTTIDDKNPTNKSIKLTFPKRYAGLSTVNTFTLKFDTKDIAKKQGNIWEVTIPGIAEPADFDSYSTTIVTPASFGEASVIKPAIENNSASNIKLTKEEVGRAGVYILYGQKQYYAFTVKYNISNPNLFPVKTEIALPRQTNYQNVLINEFSSEPYDVIKDRDGNWLASYRLSPQQKKTVVVKGVIELFASPQREELSASQVRDYTQPRKYWDATTPAINKAAQGMSTPKDIYNYVQKTLSYNYTKIATDNIRLGGKGALATPNNSVCLEFTDLFISLARAKGIPARSVEGYAYTQNTKLRPRSLANDILHAWPEYYSQSQKRWVMVDPTWGNTTKGMDYYENLDFSHIAFVIKGLDSEYPIPAGGYKFDTTSKDVEVSFAKASQFVANQKLKIADTFPDFSFPKMTIQGSFEIQNTGNAPFENAVVNVVTNRKTTRQFLIDYIPPGGIKRITTSFSDVPFLTNGNEVITMQIGNEKYVKTIKISFVPDITQLLFIGGILGGASIVAAITFRTGSVLVQRRKGKNSIRR